MTTWAVLGVVIVAAFLAVILRQSRPEQAMALTLVTGVVLLAAVLTAGVPALMRIGALLQSTAVGGEYSTVLLKALGICLLTQTAADVCRDAGETALAGKAELAGKLLLLLCGLPLFEQAARLLTSLINGQGVSG